MIFTEKKNNNYIAPNIDIHRLSSEDIMFGSPITPDRITSNGLEDTSDAILSWWY